jgi:selenocysteine-specific elongation factor
LITSIDPEHDLGRLRIYTPKERRGVVSRLGDPYRRQDDGKIVRYEIFGSDLFKKETIMKPFIGMKIETERGCIGMYTM